MSTQPRSVVITAAQAAVLRALTEDGPENKLIARRLGIRPDTVRTHMKCLLRAADCPNRTALAVAVLRGDIRPAVRGRDEWWKENAA